MYKGFNVNLFNWKKNEFYDKCLSIGKNLYAKNRNEIKKTIDGFKNDNGNLNGSLMIANWFPEIDADVFLSHSHRDKEIAIALAGLLKSKFDLNTFIDSSVWGYSNELIQLLDDEYCYNISSDTYDYTKSINSSSHVHMMLINAIIKMIDLSECLFFLNTPNSIQPENVINKTISPWIYSEIALTKLIRVKLPEEHRFLDNKWEIMEQARNFSVEYDVELDHLYNINIDTIKKWIEIRHEIDDVYSLDLLYNLIP